jgi:hypothetical protein
MITAFTDTAAAGVITDTAVAGVAVIGTVIADTAITV